MKRMASLLLALTALLTVPAGAAEFSDVAENAWYAPAVTDVQARGLMNGMGGDTFQPDTTLSRAMTVTVLWRLAGEPEASSPSPFTDVPQDAWYAKAVAWAAEVNAVEGITAETFAPDQPVTREQLAVIFHRWAEGQGYDTLPNQCYDQLTIDDFPAVDLEEVSDWAMDGVIWAVRHHLMVPKWPEEVPPHIPHIILALEAGDPASRGEVAVFLSRLCQTFTDEDAGLTPATAQVCYMNDITGDRKPFLVVTTPDPTGEGSRFMILDVGVAHMSKEILYNCQLETSLPEFAECTLPDSPLDRLVDPSQIPATITYQLTYDRQGNPAFVHVYTVPLFERTCFALHYEKSDAGWVLTGVNRDRNDLLLF